MNPALGRTLADLGRALVAVGEALQEAEAAQQTRTTSDLIALRDCGTPIRTARAAIAAGDLAAVKLGRAYYVERSELARWIASQAVEPRSIARAAAPAPVADDAVDEQIDRALAAGRLRVVRGRR